MDYYNNLNQNSALTSIFGGFTIFALIIGLLLVAFLIVCIIANWKLYKKAGKNGWECIVPFYGYWVLVEIAGLNWWWFLLIICDSAVSLLDIDGLSIYTNLVSLFASFNCYYNIAKKFNKDTGYSVCAGLFSGLFILILGFSKNEVYDHNILVSKNGVLGPLTNNNSNNESQHSTKNYETNEQTHNFSFCGNCGTKLNKDTKFCPNCGQKKS